MKNVFRKMTAALLCVLMLLSVGITGAFAADGDDAAPAGASDSAEDSSVDAGINFADKLAGTIYRFLRFMHDMYKTFILKDGQDDPWANFFEGDTGLIKLGEELNAIFPFAKR